MTIRLELAPEVEARLEETAANAGLSAEEYLKRTLQRLLPAQPAGARAEQTPRTGAELIARLNELDQPSVYAGYPDSLDSPELARKLRQEAEAHRAEVRRRS